MASQSETIMHHIQQKRRDIARDLNQLNQSARATYEEATNWRGLIRRNAVIAVAGFLTLGVILGLVVGNWTSGRS